jgi:signal transduction histidine kinase
MLELLQKNETLRDVPELQLQWLIDHSEIREYNVGDEIFKPGDPIRYMMILLEGYAELTMKQNGQLRLMAKINPGSITGALPYSRAVNASGYGIIKEKSRVLLFDRENFHELICNHFELTEKLVHLMSNRVRDFSRSRHQNEKLMALGKLSAGLAHELNNPSAAIIRSAADLSEMLKLLPEKFAALQKVALNEEQLTYLGQLILEKTALMDEPIHESLLEKTSREDGMVEWMEDFEINNGYELAELLTELGFDSDDLEDLAGIIPEGRQEVLEWIESQLTSFSTARQIREAGKRISSLVASIKAYSHMDRSQEKDEMVVHEGLKNTLQILQHKIRKQNIKVSLEFDPTLPAIKGSPGELNQIWTNLIDNAIDAMETGGNLIIATRQEHQKVIVELTDNGSGIPAEIKDQIFDPFFTTKDVGKGSGLGLEIVKNIVDDHLGEIELETKPGKTTFRILFPIFS